MPEYLAPGVYVEEVDTGSKPIEGVSTSTAGMVGVTERGPVNVPILVTSAGDFYRKFGGRLDFEEFTRRDPATQKNRCHAYLPYAVEGFFKNLGKRIYVNRVVPTGAANANRSLFDRGDAGNTDTVLLIGAVRETGTAANPPLLRVADMGTIAQNDFIRIGNGSRAEYHRVVSPPTAVAAPNNEAILPLDVGAYEDYPQGAVIASVDILDDDRNVDGGSFPPLNNTFMLDNVIGLENASRINVNGEIAAIQTVDNENRVITLINPLASGAPADGNIITSAAKQFSVDGSSFPPQANTFMFNNVASLATGSQINVNGEIGTINSVDSVTRIAVLNAPLVGGAPADGDTVTSADKLLTATANTGQVILALDNRLGLNAGDILRIGVIEDVEYITIAEVQGDRSVSPDTGNVLLTRPLRQLHNEGSVVRRQHPAQNNSLHPDATIIFNATEHTNQLYTQQGQFYLADEIVSITLPSNAVNFHRLEANADPLSNMRDIELDEALEYDHDIGQPIVERTALIDIFALDPGSWGNRLRISVDDEGNGLASDALVTWLDAVTPINNQLRLSTLTGVEPGTVLEPFDPATGNSVGGLLKVRAVDRSADNLVTLDGNMLDNNHFAAVVLHVRSREFRLITRVLREPDSAVPTRNDTVIDSEIFDHLSMDPRHSRYFERIIGTTWTPGSETDDNNNPLRRSDRRSEGESLYIRARDLAFTGNEAESIRLGPETLVDFLPRGTERAARHPLVNGNDGIDSISSNTLADAMYQGQDAVDPENRTGMFSLRNIEQISLVACPGQTSTTVQQSLIDHCEAMRYRFAVLDGPGPNNDTLADVQNQRQQFDTKYAALYHPWLQIPDPMPGNLASIAQAALPPSGHVLGIFARTDNERGVHRAPANEVVRGITGLTRQLNKGEHDILNPFPVNINVIRDFRTNNRGIRVWGARCISSDPDYKYVNVRRLMIFLEHSIDRGLQWVVFEPNAEPLWARVTRSIANFLTVVWRNHALEGTTPEQGFFVKCDRTTMTQTDIDNGRLICVIGVAPVKPAEFVIIRIGLWTGNAEQQ